MTSQNSNIRNFARHNDDDNDCAVKWPKNNIFRGKFRFVVLIIGTICLTSIFSNVITINITLICMDPTAADAETAKNVTARRSSQNPTHLYTEYEKTALQWSVSIASGLATFPLSYLCTRYGARLPFFASGLASAFATALIPTAAHWGFVAFTAARVFQGFAYACDFAVIGVLCARWAPLGEYGIYIALLTSFTPLASFLTSTLSGVICETSFLGWPYVHYFHAVFCVAVFAVWFLCYTDDPKANRFVSREELAVIYRGKTDSHINHERFVPYKAVFRTPVIWVVWLNAFVELSCGMFIIVYVPTFLKKVLNFGIEETGMFGGLIVVIKIPFKLFCGIFSDSFHCTSEWYKMRVFNTFATCISVLTYAALCFVPARLPLLAVALFAVSEASSSASCGGFYKCGALASRQYSEFVLASTQFVKSVAFFVMPALVALFVRDESDAAQWHIIFAIVAVALFTANVIFCIFATDKPCQFTKIRSDEYGIKQIDYHLPTNFDKK